jgi:hypothetical protein
LLRPHPPHSLQRPGLLPFLALCKVAVVDFLLRYSEGCFSVPCRTFRRLPSPGHSFFSPKGLRDTANQKIGLGWAGMLFWWKIPLGFFFFYNRAWVLSHLLEVWWLRASGLTTLNSTVVSKRVKTSVLPKQNKISLSSECVNTVTN